MKRKIFFTSDWHLGHANVLKFCSRPFETVEQMSREFVKRYNNVVKDEDKCFFLGDMGFSNWEITNDIISQLKGTKVLITGNHDRGYYSMYDAGFDVVMHGAVIFLGQKKISLSHYPLIGIPREDVTEMKGGTPGDSWHGETKLGKYALQDDGQYHLHGHIHSPNGGKSICRSGRQFDVGMDANNYTPVSMSMVESWIKRSE